MRLHTLHVSIEILLGILGHQLKSSKVCMVVSLVPRLSPRKGEPGNEGNLIQTWRAGNQTIYVLVAKWLYTVLGHHNFKLMIKYVWCSLKYQPETEKATEW